MHALFTNHNHAALRTKGIVILRKSCTLGEYRIYTPCTTPDPPDNVGACDFFPYGCCTRMLYSTETLLGSYSSSSVQVRATQALANLDRAGSPMAGGEWLVTSFAAVMGHFPGLCAFIIYLTREHARHQSGSVGAMRPTLASARQTRG